jgi:hypothetical protein
VAQWLERRCQDLMILMSRIRIPLWDVGVGLPDRIKRGPVLQQLWHVKELSLLKAVIAKHTSKFAALSPVMVTTAR